jgi:hypothetical protein
MRPRTAAASRTCGQPTKRKASLIRREPGVVRMLLAATRTGQGSVRQGGGREESDPGGPAPCLPNVARGLCLTAPLCREFVVRVDARAREVSVAPSAGNAMASSITTKGES